MDRRLFTQASIGAAIAAALNPSAFAQSAMPFEQVKVLYGL
jgi:hypothetical protein